MNDHILLPVVLLNQILTWIVPREVLPVNCLMILTLFKSCNNKNYVTIELK